MKRPSESSSSAVLGREEKYGILLQFKTRNTENKQHKNLREKGSEKTEL